MTAREEHASHPAERRALARSDRRYGLLTRVWVPVVGALMALDAILIPSSTRLVAIVALVLIIGAIAVSALSFGRIAPVRGFALVSILLDGVALITAAGSASGNDAALFLPFLGSLLLVPFVSGRRLAVALVLNWTVGVVAALFAYTLSPLRGIAEVEPLAANIAAAAVQGGIGYGILWWVADRFAGALEAAHAAEGRAIAAEREALEVARDREALLASSPVATVTLDGDGQIDTWNTAAEWLLGWRAEDVIGRSSLGVVPADQLPAMVRRAAAARAGEAVWGERTNLRHRDGTLVAVEVYLAGRLAPGGAERAGLICQLVDVGEREILQARLAEVARLEAIGQLAGGIAHDFNNLLTAVSGYAELIGADPSLAPERRDDVEEITQAARRGASLVHQLLTFSRYEPATPQVVDFGALVRGILPMLERLIGAEVTIEAHLPAESLHVRVDPAQAEQVLVNLGVNARDAMPGGGTLRITMEPVEVDGAEPGVAEVAPGAYALLSVADTGVGMDGPTLARVFEPFFTTKPAGTGTGLGLATTFGIVRGAGGAIRASSTPGKGSTFRVLLPRLEMAPGQPGGVRELATPMGRGETILVVDDEEPVREFVRRALERLGYRVLVAASPTSALLLAASHDGAIELLLTDVVMPEMRGPTLAASISAGRPRIRTLYMSGYTAIPALAGEEIATRDSFLAKPFRVAELALAVRAALDGALGPGAPA